MSTSRRQWIRCPCSATFQAEVFDGLHVSRRPDLRAQILEGKFHRFACPVCGEPVLLESRLAYTDFPRRQWITVFPRIDLRHRDELAAFAQRSFAMTMHERAPEMVQSWAAEMTQRVVFGLAALREKLVLFDAGLDDRVIELLKLQLCRAGEATLHPDTYFHVASVDSDSVIFELGEPEERPRLLPVPRSRYVMLQLAIGERTDELAGEVPWLPRRRDSDGDQGHGQPGDLVVDYRVLLTPSIPLAAAKGAQP